MFLSFSADGIVYTCMYREFSFPPRARGRTMTAVEDGRFLYDICVQVNELKVSFFKL